MSSRHLIMSFESSETPSAISPRTSRSPRSLPSSQKARLAAQWNSMNLPCCWAYSVASSAYMVLGVILGGRMISPASLA